jgi:hypothetical protein
MDCHARDRDRDPRRCGHGHERHRGLHDARLIVSLGREDEKWDED